VTFGFVDRGGSSVELVWSQDSTLYRDSSSSGFGPTPYRPLPSLAFRVSGSLVVFVRPGAAALVVAITRR
jgi:hypothetical protein